MALHKAAWAAGDALDLSGGGADRDAFWDDDRAAQCLLRSGGQPGHLFCLFRASEICAGTRHQRICGGVAGSVGSQSFLRLRRTMHDDAHPIGDPLEELRARYDRLNSLYQVGNVIHSTLEPQEALQLILREAVRLMRASSGSAVLINPTTGFLEILASEGLPEHAAELKLRIGEGITGWVARAGKPARVGDVAQDPRYVMVERNICSELAVPLEVEGQVRGVLNVDSDRIDAFSETDQV